MQLVLIFYTSSLHLADNLRSLALIESINLLLREILSAQLLGEQDVHLVEGSVFGLWKAEVCPDESEEGGCAPDEAGVALKVPLCRVHEVSVYLLV